MTAWSAARSAAATALCAALCGCGSGDSAPAAATPTAPSYRLGGTVSSAGGTIVLQDNGGDDLTLANVGTFAFATQLAAGAAYAVTVKSSPTVPLQTCVARSAGGGAASGTIGTADVSDLAIVCSPVPVRLGGTVSGMTGSGLILTDGAQFVTVNANGSFQFPQTIPSTASYSVAVYVQPSSPAQVCAVTHGAGEPPSTDVVDVQVTCTSSTGGPCPTGGPVVMHSSDISASESWAGDGTQHRVTRVITISAPATVTIEPCAIVEFDDDAGIDVRGATTGTSTAALVAAGNDSFSGYIIFQPTQFNNVQSWRGLRGLNANSRIDLAFTTVGWAGKGGSTATIQMQGGSTLPDPVLRVFNVQIQDSGGPGIRLSNAAFTSDSTQLGLVDGAGFPIELSAMALGSIPSGLGVERNGHDEILVVDNANIFDNLTIRTPVPIRFDTSGVHVGGLAPTFVPDMTLTLEAGVTLRFAKWSTGPTMVTFGDIGQAHDKNAVLVVRGTAASPVTLTSAEAVPAPGDWAGLWLMTSNGSQIDHLQLQYAGGDAAVGPASCGPATARHTAALLVGNGTDNQYLPSSVLITNSTFSNNGGNFAIDSVWQAPAFGPTLTATNTFTSTGAVCRQSKNYLSGGCVGGGVDQRGCLVP